MATDLRAQLRQAVLNARAARLARGPHGERLTRTQTEQLVGEVHACIDSMLDRMALH